MIEHKYICDECENDVAITEAGKLYGPLCFTITGPAHTHEIVEVQFCSLDHALKWLAAHVGKTVLE